MFGDAAIVNYDGRMQRLDPVSLRLFIAVVEEKTIAAAARREHIAAAAVSKRLADIESVLEVSLLQRTNRGVEPTDAGRAFLTLARSALNGLEQIPAQMKSYSSGTRGLVRICASMSSITQFLPADLQTFMQGNPGVQVNLDEKISSEVIEAVRENSADIGIFSNVQNTWPLEVFDYRSDKLVLIVPRGHVLAAQSAWRFEQTLEYDYIGWETGSAINLQLSNAAMHAQKPWRLRIRISSFDALCMMVDSGLGIGVLPQTVARRSLQNLNIEIRQLEDEWALRRFRVCVRARDALTPAAAKMLAHLQEVAGPDVASPG